MNNNRAHHRYELIRSKQHFCVPTVLKMIIDSEGFEHISIEKISSFFTIYVPIDNNNKKKYSARTHDAKMIGAHINNGEINNFLTKNNIPLREEYYSIFTLEEYAYANILDQEVSSRNHIICGYSFGKLFNKKDAESLGHVSLVLNIDGKFLTILNPGPDCSGETVVKIEDMYSASKSASGGLWVLKGLEEF